MDPEACAGCHPQHYEEWASSAHAYASDDPLFLAMNRRGQRETELGDFCIKCHAPMALRTGATKTGSNLGDLPRALKGVTCYFCHSVESVAGTHNNPLVLSDDGVMRGPFDDPLDNAVHGSSYSSLLDRDRLESAQVCGGCHDIVNPLGTHIERTFAEWQQSVFSQDSVGTTCAQCHMDQGTERERAADAQAAPLRRLHSHRFPAVDLPLTAWPGAETLAEQTQDFLDTALQSAVCVRGAGTASDIQVVLDNVAGGHSFPSGAAQDRRFWAEVTAYTGDETIYQSGAVPEGTAITTLDDPDLWLVRDCLLNDTDDEVHMFWEASDYESNLLPAQQTLDRSDARFYQSHVVQTYPRDGRTLSSYPDRVTVRFYLRAFALDVFDSLVESGDLLDTDDYSVEELRDRLAPWALGEELEWTVDDPDKEEFTEGALPISCVSNTNLSGAVDTVPAVDPVRCAR